MKKRYVVEVLASATVKFTKVVAAETEEEAKKSFADDVLTCADIAPINQPDIAIAESPALGHDFELEDIHAEEITWETEPESGPA
jgi:hypothetical protein